MKSGTSRSRAPRISDSNSAGAGHGRIARQSDQVTRGAGQILNAEDDRGQVSIALFSGDIHEASFHRSRGKTSN